MLADLTVTLNWTAVGVMFGVLVAVGGGYGFIWSWSRATKYQGKRQKKIIKAIFRQGKAMQAQARVLSAIRSDQKRIMQNMANPLSPTDLGATGIMDALPEDMNVDGLFNDEDLSDEDD